MPEEPQSVSALDLLNKRNTVSALDLLKKKEPSVPSLEGSQPPLKPSGESGYSPSLTISFEDFEVKNPIDNTAVDISTIDISKYNKQYKPRTSETTFPKMEEIPELSKKDGVTPYVKDVFTSNPKKGGTNKPIIEEAEVKKVAEVAKSIDNEEDYSMFTQAMSYLDQVSNSLAGEASETKDQVIEGIKDITKSTSEELAKYYGFAKRLAVKQGLSNQDVGLDSVPDFIPVGTSESIEHEITPSDTLPSITQTFTSTPDHFWRAQANVDLKGVKKASDIEHTLFNYRNEFDGNNGFTYGTLPANGNENAPEKLDGLSGVAHFFIRDGRPKWAKDIWEATNKDLKRESDWFKKGGPSEELGYSVSNFNRLKPMEYVPVFRKTGEGAGSNLRVVYKKKEDVTENDYVTQNLEQMKYGDIAWGNRTQDEQYDDINVVADKKGNPIPSLPILAGEVDGKHVAGEDLYSRFSGSALVFLLESDGKTVANDYSGSIKNIKLEAERLAKKYKIPLDDIVLGFYDAGSYSAKPAANSKGKLDRRQWSDYNKKPESGSGIGIRNK